MFRGLATFLLVLSLAQGVLASQCPDLVSTLQGPIDAQSINQKIQNLSALKLSLDLAKVSGATNIDITAMRAHYEAKENELVAYLEKNKIMTRNELIAEVKLKITQLQKQNNTNREESKKNKDEESRRKKEQEQLIKESVIDGTRAISHRIKPDKFEMGEVGQQKPVTLTKSFDMMATPTTQLLYKTIATLANIKFPDSYNIEADPSKFKGQDLNPVEQVSYEDVQIWLKALNELSQAGEPILTDLIPGHKQGDVYRLPTEAEWEFVIRGRGALNKIYHFGDKEEGLNDHAWYSANSGHTTHPVAQKKPLIIDGKEFYDMHGNVWEWVHDWYGEKLTGRVDPQGPKTGSGRVFRGGSWSNFAKDLRSASRVSGFPDFRFYHLGFRFVRVVK